MTDTERAIAEYLARGNTITRYATDDSSGITAREWSRMVRGEPRDHASNDEAPSVRVAAIDHLGREHLVNERGEYVGIA